MTKSRQDKIDRVMEYLATGPKTAKEISGKTNISASNVLHILGQMSTDGLIYIAHHRKRPGGHGAPIRVFAITNTHTAKCADWTEMSRDVAWRELAAMNAEAPRIGIWGI